MFWSHKDIFNNNLIGNILVIWQNCTIYFLARLLLGINVPLHVKVSVQVKRSKKIKALNSGKICTQRLWKRILPLLASVCWLLSVDPLFWVFRVGMVSWERWDSFQFPFLELSLGLLLELCQPPSQTPGRRLNACGHTRSLLKHRLYNNCLSTSNILTIISCWWTHQGWRWGSSALQSLSFSTAIFLFINWMSSLPPSPQVQPMKELKRIVKIYSNTVWPILEQTHLREESSPDFNNLFSLCLNPSLF